MSYEKITTLIDQAPDVSQWWMSNKNSLKWWSRGLRTVQFFVAAIYVVSAFAAMPLIGWWIMNKLPADQHWMLLAAISGIFGGLVTIRCSDKMFPKRFTYNGLNLRGSVREETVTLNMMHDVLSKAVTINDPQMKPILARLNALKNMDLPECWWEALSNELDNLTPKAPVVTKSIVEKLDAVYVQIEDVTAAPTPSKVLRL